MSKARDDLHNTLNKLIGIGLLYDANVEELKPTYWRVHLFIPEASYFDRAKSRAVIKKSQTPLIADTRFIPTSTFTRSVSAMYIQ